MWFQLFCINMYIYLPRKVVIWLFNKYLMKARIKEYTLSKNFNIEWILISPFEAFKKTSLASRHYQPMIHPICQKEYTLQATLVINLSSFAAFLIKHTPENGLSLVFNIWKSRSLTKKVEPDHTALAFIIFWKCERCSLI